MGDFENLTEMGFDPRRVKLALKNTRSFNDAITWLADNENIDIDELEAKEASSSASASAPAERGEQGEEGEGATDASGEGASAQSLRCKECGKLFKTPATAQFHATKTGHDEFEESAEEIQPLTEEEKAAKLAELRSKLAEKRATQSILDQQEQKKNELIRRKRDADSERIKEELRRKEQEKEAEKRKREKKEDALAKEKIRAKIKADQEARRIKAEKEKAAREGRTVDIPVPGPSTAVPAAAAPPAHRPAGDYKESRLQLRLPSGAPLVKSFPVSATLYEVAAAIAMDRGFSANSFTTMFPRKTYGLTEFGMTLAEAKLVPSAALIVA